jgi:DNA processing protein
MNVNTLTVKQSAYPSRLLQLASPPQQLYVRGDLSALLDKPTVAIVGSRSVSPYGREVTSKLAQALAEQGIVIISGLALGVDAIAHRAALDAGGLTIAVLPSSVEHPYPASHRNLAEQIVQQGGVLLSEYPGGAVPYKQNFVARNRIVAGLCDALLITEAAEKSGSLHTARFALETGRDVLVVPGSIYSRTSTGTNNLLKSGATPVTNMDDILQVLGIDTRTTRSKPIPKGSNLHEQRIIDLIAAGQNDGAELLLQSKLDIAAFNQALTMLEITGKVRGLGANQWSLA